MDLLSSSSLRNHRFLRRTKKRIRWMGEDIGDEKVDFGKSSCCGGDDTEM